MVTRRTRVLSAIAVVLMLVSMFTTFVLPAAALEVETPEGLVAYKNRTADDGLKNYAITDAEDWMDACRDSNKQKTGPLGGAKYENFSGITLWFTNDIDFADVTLSTTSANDYFFNRYTSSSGAKFKGTIQGQGYAIKNMNIDATYKTANGNYSKIGLISYGDGCKVYNLTIDQSCSFIYKVEDNGNADELLTFYMGIFMGAGTYNCTFVNCHNEADAELTRLNPSTSSVSSISVFGDNANAKWGTILINCSNSGNITNHDTGYACAFVVGVDNPTDTSTKFTAMNCYNTGKLTSAYEGTEDRTGLFSTNKGLAAVDKINIVNTYSIGDSVACGVDMVSELEAMGTVLPETAVTSGELAYLLNKNYTEYSKLAVERKYFTIDNGKVVVGDAETQTVKVQAYNGETPLGVAYVNIGDILDVTTLKGDTTPMGYAADSGILNGTTLTVGAPAEGNEVKVLVLTTNELFTDYLDAKLAYLAERDLSFFKDEDRNALKAADVQNIQNKTFANQTEVNDALNFLNTFTFDYETIVPIADIEKYPEVLNYSVATKAEMEALATVFSTFTTAHTVHIIDNIDMESTKDAPSAVRFNAMKASIDGGNKTISNLWLTDSWLGNFGGEYVKDLTFKNCGYNTTSGTRGFLINTVNREVTVSNITLDNVIGTVTDLKEGIQGLLIGSVSGEAAYLHLYDVEIVNSTMNRPKTSSYWNSGLVFGKTYWGKVDADGIYLNNNTLTGETSGSGAGIAFGEIICSATIKNVIILNTTADPAHHRGILTSMFKDHGSNYEVNPVGNFENIITYNNGGISNLIATSAANEAETVNISNVFTDCEMIHNTDLSTVTMTDCNVNQTTSIGNGLAAWTLNQTESTKSYSMDGSTPIFASETAKATVAVTFKALDAKLKDTTAPIASYKHFTDKDGKITVPQSLLDFASWDNEAGLSEATYDVDTVVYGYTTPAHDHQLSYTDNGDGKHTATCTFSHTDEELNETFTCDYSEINSHEYERKNVSATNTEEAGAHRVVDACIYCDFETDGSQACEGTLSVNDEESWAATCAGAGQTTTVCSACDYKHVKVEAQLPHTWGDWTHIEGTDTHKRTCANVENCQVPDQVEGCVFENWAETVPPTVAGPGEKTGYCTCGNIKKEPVPALTGILLNPGKAIVGNVLEVEVNIENNEKTVAGVELAITYNADLLTLQGAKAGKWDVVFDDRFPAASGLTTIDFNVISNAGMDGDGTVVVLQFAVVNDEAYAGALTDLKVAVNEAYDMDFDPMRFAEANATIEIETALIKGDIDGNRFVNMADAILLLRYYTEKPQGATEYTVNNLTITDKIADITDEGDGVDLGEGQFAPEVNINDVLHLLRYLNGWYTDAEFFGE